MKGRPLKKGDPAEKEPRMLRERDLERHMEEEGKTKEPDNGNEVPAGTKKSPGEEEADDPTTGQCPALTEKLGGFFTGL